MSYNNNNNNNNNGQVQTPKWTEIASAWKGKMPQSGEDTLNIKIKKGLTVTLSDSTPIQLYVNKNKNVNNPADSKKPDFRVMVPNDGSVVPVQQAAAKQGGGYNNNGQNYNGYGNNGYGNNNNNNNNGNGNPYGGNSYGNGNAYGGGNNAYGGGNNNGGNAYNQGSNNGNNAYGTPNQKVDNNNQKNDYEDISETNLPSF